MKAGWETVRLADICTFRPPKSEARKKLAETDMVSFAPMEDLGIDQKYLEPSGVRPLDSVAGSYTYFADGDVLLAKITPCFENGKLGIARDLENGIGFGSSEYFVIRPSSRVTAEYLYYFLSQPSFREAGAQSMTGAVGHKRVAKDFLEEHVLPLPSPAEQQRIVAILDEAFAGIATARAVAEQNRQNARALFESHLQTIFSQRGEGWVTRKMGDVYDVRDGTHDSPKFYDSGYPLVTSKNLKRHGLDLTSVKYITEDDYNKINQRSAVNVGDILFAMIGTIGNPVLVETAPNYAIKNMALFKVPSDQSSEFLRYYLSAEMTLSKMKREANGTTQKFVGLGYLRSFEIALPELQTQQRVVEELDELGAETQRLEALYLRKLEALDELKQSLLHQAFSGQL